MASSIHTLRAHLAISSQRAEDAYLEIKLATTERERRMFTVRYHAANAAACGIDDLIMTQYPETQVMSTHDLYAVEWYGVTPREWTPLAA